jgi:CBS domain-containing protein
MSKPVSRHLLEHLRQQLSGTLPFSEMQTADIDDFLLHCTESYFGPNELIISPAHGIVKRLYLIRQGSVTGTRGIAEASGGAIELESGDLFPVSAAVGERPVSASYRACADTFCLVLPVAHMQVLAKRSTAFAEFLNRRALKFLEQSRKLIQAAYASQALAEQSLETPLGELSRKQALTVGPQTPIRDALETMHTRKIGSMLVTDTQGKLLGILTRSDVIGGIILKGVDLCQPIGSVMNSPVKALTIKDTAHDAALFMSRHNIRHIPVLDGDRLVNIISERDLFANQRLSVKSVASSIQKAPDAAALLACAADIRRLARTLLGQGIRARQLTEFLSQLNDVLTERLIVLIAARHPVDLNRFSWVALGSEGRGEQTIATDQDNAIVFDSEDPDRDRSTYLAFATEVNQALDACGYPLCKGGIMASNPACCLSRHEWLQRFAHWIEHGTPEDLLKASIFFDFRHIAGNQEMLRYMREFVRQQAMSTQRFTKLLADNALRTRVPLNWRGAVDTRTVNGRETLDLKLQGTALVVDAAQIYGLAKGVTALNTRERLEQAGTALGVPDHEKLGWVSAFEYLQLMRLTAQIEERGLEGNPNLIDFKALNDVDRRVLRISLRSIQSLQQRLELDFGRPT